MRIAIVALLLVSSAAAAATTAQQDATFMAALKLWLSQNAATAPVPAVTPTHPTLLVP
jgi:hypothetical protein